MREKWKRCGAALGLSWVTPSAEGEDQGDRGPQEPIKLIALMCCTEVKGVLRRTIQLRIITEGNGAGWS